MKSTSALFLALFQFGCCATAAAAPPISQKDGDRVRATPDQLHQLAVAKVELYPFRLTKAAIGQIAYNEDTSTAVLAPFSGRATRLIAKVGDNVKRGDALFELDNGMHENEFVYVYFGRLETEPRPDPAEVADVAFLSCAEINRRIKREPDTFAFWFKDYFRSHGPKIARLAREASGLPAR